MCHLSIGDFGTLLILTVIQLCYKYNNSIFYFCFNPNCDQLFRVYNIELQICRWDLNWKFPVGAYFILKLTKRWLSFGQARSTKFSRVTSEGKGVWWTSSTAAFYWKRKSLNLTVSEWTILMSFISPVRKKTIMMTVRSSMNSISRLL